MVCPVLKITIHDSADECRFQLAGALAGPPVRELAQTWETARSTTRGRRTTIDLRGVTQKDAAGEALLEEMFRAGVAVVEAPTPARRRRKLHCSAALLAPSLLLLTAALQPLG
jgi:ABC-type transporter Mla MlaB component